MAFFDRHFICPVPLYNVLKYPLILRLLTADKLVRLLNLKLNLHPFFLTPKEGEMSSLFAGGGLECKTRDLLSPTTKIHGEKQ